MKKTLAAAAILMAAFCWGCIAVFYRHLSLLGFTASQIVFLRVLTAAVLMFMIVFIKDKTLLKIKIRDCWLFIGTGVCSLAFFNYCYFNAIDMLSPSIAAVLLYTAPIIVLLLSVVLFKERLSLFKITALCLTFIGCVLVTDVLNNGRVTALGILFGMGAGIGYALYTIFGVFALKRYDTMTVTFYTFLFASVGILPICDITSLTVTASYNLLSTVAGSVIIGCVSSLIPYLLYTFGLKHISPSNASMMATLEPVVATVNGVLFLNDTINLYQMFGIALIVCAIILINIPFERKRDQL